MSVDSFSSFTGSFSSSSSSSSSSGSSSSSSSSSSSGASFSSCSTVIAAQPFVRPFGSPEYNYFWIENKSKTNPKLSYFYNYKSNTVVWHRPVSKDVSLPLYTHQLAPAEINLSEDDENILVSDVEDYLHRQKRLLIRKRNQRLANVENDGSVQVLSVKKALKSKKMLNTFWKLYRHPGETVEDIKNRMIVSIPNKVHIKTEIPSNDDDLSILEEHTKIPIKQEPIFLENDSLKTEPVDKPIKKLNEDSDSDPENVSYLIKQEYLMTYSDSELEDDNEDEQSKEEIPLELERNSESAAETEEEDEVSDLEEEESLSEEYNVQTADIFNTNSVNDEYYGVSDDESFAEQYLLADYFDIEINEENKENVSLPNNDSNDNPSVVEDDINWTFEKSSNNVNDDSLLTSRLLNPVYGLPKLKEIGNKQLLSKKNKKKPKRLTKKTPLKKVIKTEPGIAVKREPADDLSDKPIICDMYGVRTINYNHPKKLKVPKWQNTSRLSASSGDDSGCEFQSPIVKQEFGVNKLPVVKRETIPQKISCAKTKSKNPLELKSWFPKPRNRKRRWSPSKSDGSWCCSSLSEHSDVDDFDVALIRMKKEKRSPSPESEREIPKIKMEPRLSNSAAGESKTTVSMTPAAAAAPPVDLSIVKVERRSPDLEDAGKSADSGSSSSSSSCTCSRSSCSCSSSSSSSSDDENDGAADKEAKREDL